MTRRRVHPRQAQLLRNMKKKKLSIERAGFQVRPKLSHGPHLVFGEKLSEFVQVNGYREAITSSTTDFPCLGEFQNLCMNREPGKLRLLIIYRSMQLTSCSE